MAILNFPNTRLDGSPLQSGDQYTGDNGVTYIFDGVKWVGRAVAQPAGTNSITNNGKVVQVDVDGNLVIPIGSTIIYEGGAPAISSDRLVNGSLNVHLDSSGHLVFPAGSEHYDLGAGEGILSHNIDVNTNSWAFGGTGILTIPGSITAQDGNDLNLTSWNPTVDGIPGGVTISLQNRDIETGNRNTKLDIAPDNITLITDFSNAENTWTFGADSKLTLPNGSTIGSNDSFDGIPMTTARGTILFGNSPRVGQPDHFHIAKQDPGNLNLFLGDDSNFVKLPSYGGVEITSEGTTQYTWAFGTDGSLTLPQGAQLLEKTWTTAITDITIGSETFVTFADTEFMMVEEGQIVIENIANGTTEANGTWYYRASDGNQCQLFTDESYSFPVDSSAWTTYISGGGTATLVTELELTSGNNTWKFSRDGSTTVPNGGKVIFGEQNGGSYISAGMGFHFNSTEGIALDAVDVQTDAAHPITRSWYFDPKGSLTLPNYVKQNTNPSVVCNTGTDTVVYTGSDQYLHTFKLLIKVEGHEVDNFTQWETQSTEMIIAKSYNGDKVAATAYGVVHTSVDPLATFTARWNPTISRVEVLCRPTSLLYPVEVRTFATEIFTSD